MARIPVSDVNISSYQAFRDQMDGNWVDVDGSYGAQCWDGCAVLWTKLGWDLQTQPGGNGSAYQCWTVSRDYNTHPPTITQVTRLEDLRRGDVVVIRANVPGWTGSDGHIAYCDENMLGGELYIPIFGQNQGGTPVPAGGAVFNLSRIPSSSFLGAFRYDAWQSPVPPPTPTEEKKHKFPWFIYSQRRRTRI